MILHGKRTIDTEDDSRVELSWKLANQSYTNNKSNLYIEVKLITGKNPIARMFNHYFEIKTLNPKTNAYELQYSAETDENRQIIDAYSEYIITSGTYDLDHYNKISNLGIAISFKAYNFYLRNGSKAEFKNITLELPYPESGVTLYDVPTFDDESNLPLEYSYSIDEGYEKIQFGISNSQGSTVNMLVDFKDAPFNECSYVLEITEAEREKLRAATPEASRTVYVVARGVNANGTTEPFYSYIGQTTLFIKTTAPVIHSVEVEDINPITLALTGNKNAFVGGYSEVSYNINASGAKGATIAKYEALLWYDNTDPSPDNETGMIWTELGGATGSFLHRPIPFASYNNSMMFRVEDSRGAESSDKLVVIENVEYKKLTCDIFDVHMSMSSDNNTKGVAQIYIGGNFWRGDFGAKENTIKVEIRYAENGEYTEWADITVLLDDAFDGRYSLVFTASGFEHNNIYTFQVRITDELEVIETEEKTVRVTPVFDWGENDFRFNVLVNASEGITANKIEADLIKSTIINAENLGINDYFIGDFVWQTGEEAMGSNGTWHWVKWASGKAECWGKRNFGTMAVNTTWGSLKRSASFTQTLPTDLFVDTPEVMNINMVNANMGGWICRYEATAPSADNTGSFIYVRPADATLSSPTDIGFHIIGRWK